MSFNYLKLYTSLLEKTEVPERFTLWCGIATLLAALERRVWIPQGIYTIFPNFYIVLLAASGQKKSTAVNLAERMIRKMTHAPTVVAQKITPEALISTLIAEETTDDKQLLRQRMGGIVCADELVVFLDKGSLDRGLGPMLTTLYDCKTLEYMTKMHGMQRLENGYLSLLGGSTIELIRTALPADAIGGGLTSRTIFVYEEFRPEPVAWVDYDPVLEQREADLVVYLDRLSQLEGPISLTPDAKAFYIKEYNTRRRGEQRHEPFLANYENRWHAHWLKVSMAFMLNDAPQLLMERHHLYAAKVVLEESEQYLPRVMELLTSNDIGETNNAVYQFIIKHKSVDRYTLVRHLSTKMNADEVTKTINTLVESGQVVIDTNAQGKLVYRCVNGTGR